MTTDMNALKERLLEEKALLEGQLSDVGRKNPDVPGDWEAKPEDTEQQADENVAADRIEDLANNSAILGELEERYQDVLRALSRIDEGRYGICEVSGEAIEPERLDANPAARTCVAHMNDETELPK